MTASFQQFHNRLLHRPFLFLSLAFAVVQLVIGYRIGIMTGLEAEKYIEQGNLLFDSGHFSDSKYIFYLPVIVLIWLCRVLEVSYLLVVLVQVALSAISLYYFYKLSYRLGNRVIAFYSSLLLVLFFPLQVWNFFLYTDSIFISLTIIYSYLIFSNGNKGLKGTVLILLFLGLLLLSRPHGMLFIPPTILYLVFRQQTTLSRIINAGLCVLLLCGMYFLLNAAFTGGGDMDAMKPFIEEHIICFVPMKPEGAALDIIKTANPVNDLFYYLVHNPLHFLRLMGLRLHSFFNLSRDYYSTGHNIFLYLFIIPVYLFSVAGIYRLLRAKLNFSIFLLALLVLYPLGATFQCDDWHSRFTMVVFPYFILLSCLGAYYIFVKKPAQHS